MDLSRTRLEYETQGIDAADFAPEPIAQFQQWLAIAVDAELEEPNAMVVATVDDIGQPWSRFVLLKGVGDAGFEFYTNYESNKSRQLDANPKVSLTFGWTALRRQVNVAGTATRVSAKESDAYWAVRPRGSQLGGWSSAQSRTLADRAELLERYAETDAAYPDAVPRPPHWGGWRVSPHTVEFWQGRLNRLHDRLRYVAIEGGGWELERLAP
ncbi:MAG: pyridoxamine 5'-phosphate oxidase [Acidimicrobiia bacterium]|nr:pyridoxamine 5'-phosphate oxidase [Acidimicrobiia bacterium]